MAFAERQQAFLRTLMDSSLHQEMRKYPWLLYRFLDIVTDGTAVDSGWSEGGMRSLLWSLRAVRSGDITYLVMPLAQRAGSDGMHATPAAGQLDGGGGDDVASWLNDHPGAVVPTTTR